MDNEARASSTVLNIEELLARILNFLPLLDLLSSQGVCQRWKATINSSALQRSLFREPEDEPLEQWVYDRGTQLIARHPYPQQLPTSSDPLRKLCVVNEAIFQSPIAYAVLDETVAVNSSELHFRKNLDIQSLSRPPLQHMFITQPPVKRLMIVWHSWCQSTIEVLFNENGLTALDVFKGVPTAKWGTSAAALVDLHETGVWLEDGCGQRAPWLAVTLEEREMLDAVPEGQRATLSRVRT